MSDRVLVEADVPLLVEALAEWSHKWKDLGRALRLTSGAIKECDCNSSVISLQNIFKKWMKYTRKPTLSTLEKALASRFVGLGHLSDHMFQNFTSQDVAIEIADFIARKEEIIRSTAHIMIVGFPGNGKSHLLDNLLKNPRRRHYSSTGVSDSVVVVDVEAEDTTSHTSAFGIDSTWKRIETRKSFMMQLQNCKTLTATKYSGRSEKESMPSNSSLEMSTITHLTNNVMSILRHNQVKSFAQLKNTISLYFRDTGGQVEFQEILTILICGPSIFFFVENPHFIGSTFDLRIQKR